MTARYVVVRSLAGVESIIPNDTLNTSTVVNHSYTDSRVRQSVAVVIGYASDVELALKTLVDIARRQERILPEPTPKAFVTNLEASGIALELGFWMNDPEKGSKALKSALFSAILREFRQSGIEIPYPRQVVQLEKSPVSAVEIENGK
jgi:small-conductance mechanosensitive channel